jgi:hypothetical protein
MSTSSYDGLTRGDWFVETRDDAVHVCASREAFTTYRAIAPTRTALGDAIGVGAVALRTRVCAGRGSSGRKTLKTSGLVLRDCFYVPSAPVNIISAGQCQRDGDYYFDRRTLEVRAQETQDEVAGVKHAGDGRYMLHMAPAADEEATVATPGCGGSGGSCGLM